MATKNPTPKAAGPATRALRVTTKKDAFRRAGREWSGTSTVPLSVLTDEQVEAIKGEPLFVVDEVDAEPAAA